MSQRFCLFHAGYCANAPWLYYKRLSFVNEHSAAANEVVKSTVAKLAGTLDDELYQHQTNFSTAKSIADHFELQIPPLPDSPEKYFAWLKEYVSVFEKRFPMNRIDYYYFFYSRKLSEIMCNTALAGSYLNVSYELNGQLDLTSKIDNCLKDCEYILFKLIAAAALLSSEPRQNYFNVYYKSVNQDYDKFRRLDISKLNAAKKKELSADLADYGYTVMDGFKKCVGILKELEI